MELEQLWQKIDIFMNYLILKKCPNVFEFYKRLGERYGLIQKFEHSNAKKLHCSQA